MRIVPSGLLLTFALLLNCLILPNNAPCEDRISAQIQRLREGKNVALIDTEFEKLQKATVERFYDAAAEIYIEHVKWSIIYPEKYGGWPARDYLLANQSLVEPIHRRLKQKSEETIDTLFDYALICPALYISNEEEVQKLLARLEAKDEFLYNRATTQLKWWRDFISKQLGSDK
jgi:hypothetical protein